MERCLEKTCIAYPQMASILKLKKLEDWPSYDVVAQAMGGAISLTGSDKENCTILKKQKTKKFIVMKLLYVKGQNFIDYIIYHKNSKQIIDNIIHNYNYLLRTIAILIHKNI